MGKQRDLPKQQPHDFPLELGKNHFALPIDDRSSRSCRTVHVLRFSPESFAAFHDDLGLLLNAGVECKVLSEYVDPRTSRQFLTSSARSVCLQKGVAFLLHVSLRQSLPGWLYNMGIIKSNSSPELRYI